MYLKKIKSGWTCKVRVVIHGEKKRYTRSGFKTKKEALAWGEARMVARKLGLGFEDVKGVPAKIKAWKPIPIHNDFGTPLDIVNGVAMRNIKKGEEVSFLWNKDIAKIQQLKKKINKKKQNEDLNQD